jgi:ribonuclease Z
LLIADSTFSAADAEHAHESGHSTAVDAAELARKCGARQLLLTHFSGRLRQEDLPALVAEARAVFPNSSAAADLAQLKIMPSDEQF